eukprot:CAMPEP_0206599938 /NCGR_PEP_ID=MMETSP0325_2-20121206/45467_1 /ASSEMBLY_ACC=CAM_ASM_000347 /TAXON_ID=2866 /ORGANISM="Crypthecodinium cohnii, Strain Seligo" /LENGTH=540 /DNA_ID=CAMNT_0054111085 /DNA_START=129 /DNA_END=1751 /DNA_ORIENTATION=+
MSAPTTNDSDQQVRQFGLGYVVQSLSLDELSTLSGPSLLACASFIPDAGNFVELLSLDLLQPQPLRATGIRLPHYFPASKVRWLQQAAGSQRILGTCSDHVRIWSADGQLQRILAHEGNPQGVCTPVTGLDFGSSASSSSAPWLVSCDVAGQCSIYDVETGARIENLDLGQSLSDVSCGPNGLILAAGSRGDCFLIDKRCPKDVAMYESPTQAQGPAKIASGSTRSDLFAVAWQGESSGGSSVCLYGGSKGSGEARQLSYPLPSYSPAPCADLQWSPAYPEFLGCADEFGSVNLWHFPDAGIEGAKRHPGPPFFQWEPYSQHACTALALTPKVAGGNDHAVIVATMPSQGASSGSLWVTPLPVPSRSTAARGAAAAAASGGAVGLGVPASLRPGPCAGAGVGSLDGSPLVASDLPATTNLGGFDSPTADVPQPPLPPPILPPGTSSRAQASPEVRSSTFGSFQEAPTGPRSEGVDGFEGLRGLAANFGGLSSAPLSASMPPPESSPGGRGARPWGSRPPVFPVEARGDAQPGTSSFWAED